METCKKTNSAPKIRTALYGGSFNPIHTGHLQLGEYLRQKGYADEVWFLVSPLNPLKADRSHDLLSDDLRLHLVQLAVEEKEGLYVSDFEMSLPRPSYMVHTLAALRKAYPNRCFTLVIGADNWYHFDQWYEPDEILRHHEILIYPRQGFPLRQEELPHPKEGASLPHVALLDAPLYNISSTQIRNAISLGDYQGEGLSTRVWQEIQQRGLYRKK